jgi:phosphate uptake regulator
MLKELLAIFTADAPLPAATKDFNKMLKLTREMLLEASAVYWGQHQTPKQRTRLYKKDVKVNKLERRIRKQLVAHLSGPQKSAVPYALLLMSLVKDVERVGDYAKNLLEARDLLEGDLPDDELVAELGEIRQNVELLAQEAPDVFVNGDEERATELTVEGRSVSKRCDDLVWEIAHSSYAPSVAVPMTLCARYYKRIESHLLNLLSGVIMPLHKLDYFDETALPPAIMDSLDGELDSVH